MLSACLGGVNSRRSFIRNATGLWTAMCLSTLAAPAQDKADPFDSLPKSSWENTRRNGLIMIHRPAPALLSSHAQIVRPDEPGQPLIVEGQVFAPNGTTPVEGLTVYAYNTDAEGYYGIDRKEYPPRLYGWMKTDASGHFELRTIHPGNYPGMQVPAHVHFSVWGRGYPPQWVEELRFEGDRYITPEILADASTQGKFSSVQPLTRAADGVLHCRYKMKIQRETNFR